MSAIRIDLLRDLWARLEAAPRGQRKAILDDMTRFLGVSSATAYRELKSLGYCRDRKRRSDAGKSCVDKELAVKVSGLIRKGTRANGRKALKMNTVVDILEHNGFGPRVNMETGEATMPHPSTVSRAMRLHNCHPEQLVAAGQNGPHRQLRTLHPNHVWEMDASVCLIFYLPKGQMAVIDERSYNEHKPGLLAKLNDERVIRWLVVDHYSGAFFARYTQGSENARTVLEVLAEAMCGRGDTDPLRGAPRILYTDPGPAFTAELTRKWLARLDIRQETHMPGAARATGSVEVHQRIVEHGFEGRLRMYQAASLADLNARLDTWRIDYNARKLHGRHHKTRYGMWSSIREEDLRIPHNVGALLSLAMTEECTRRVKRDLTISFAPQGFGRQVYDLRSIPDIAINEELAVSVNPFAAPALDVNRDGRIHTIQPIVFDAAGFNEDAPVLGESYKATQDTAADKAIKEIDKAAYAVSSMEEVRQAEKQKKTPFADVNIFAELEANKPRLYLTRGRDLTLESTTKEEPTLDHVGAAIELRGRMLALGREWTATHMEKLRQLYPERVPSGDMGKLVRLLLDEDATERRAGMRLVAGGAA